MIRKLILTIGGVGAALVMAVPGLAKADEFHGRFDRDDVRVVRVEREGRFFQPGRYHRMERFERRENRFCRDGHYR